MAFLNGHDNFFSGALRYCQIILHFAFKGCHNFYSWAQNIGLDHYYGRKWKPTLAGSLQITKINRNLFTGLKNLFK